MTFVSTEVEVTDSSTVGDVLVNVVQCVRLDTSGKRDHALVCVRLRMPDDTLDETLGVAANRVEVDLSGRGVESHGVPCFDSYRIHEKGGRGSPPVTLVQLSPKMGTMLVLAC